jgi:uncharacterized membrane protein YdjX (TVP38/TMEM64 family)
VRLSGQPISAARTTPCQDAAAGFGRHPAAKSVSPFSDDPAWLKCTFHDESPVTDFVRMALYKRCVAASQSASVPQDARTKAAHGSVGSHAKVTGASCVGVIDGKLSGLQGMPKGDEDGVSEEQTEQPAGGGQAFNVKRLWPIAVLIAGFILFFVTGLDQYITFEALREHRTWLLEQVETNALITSLTFMVIYILVVAFSLPGGAILTIIGGFLFGLVFGTTFVVISATIGATALFLVAKTTIGDALKARMGPWLQKMEQGFQENAFSYLLAMRLIPLFPFFVVNLVPAFLGVQLKTYFLATLIGIIPGSVVFIQVGAGLGSILDSGKEFSVSNILTLDVILALCGLAILSLLPILYKKLKGRNTS